MASTTLILEGRPELVVRMALLLYLAETKKEKKKIEEKFGCSADEIEEHIDTCEDVLQQLGWKPKESGTAEVVRDNRQTDIFDGPSANPGAKPRPTITVRCGCSEELHNLRVPSTSFCPHCMASIEVIAVGDDDSKAIVRPAVTVPCVKGGHAFRAARKNSAATCSICSMRYELFFDDDGELLRAEPRPLPETGG